jgi:predicted protein tyrosine phosphatase
LTLIVCPLQAVAGTVSRSRPARLISLLAPDQAAPASFGLPHLILRFHDISEPRPGLVAPDPAMVAELLAFGAAWREPATLLAHCWMGISRSTAAALILACALDPARDEREAAQALRRASATATPNPRMVALADDLLGRQGRLSAAAAAIGRGVEASCGQPFELRVRQVSTAG